MIRLIMWLDFPARLVKVGLCRKPRGYILSSFGATVHGTSLSRSWR